jgi:hypothetical protein
MIIMLVRMMQLSQLQHTARSDASLASVDHSVSSCLVRSPTPRTSMDGPFQMFPATLQKHVVIVLIFSCRTQPLPSRRSAIAVLADAMQPMK